MPSWSIGTDTGGTFTDIVALNDDGRIIVGKTPSTPPDFEEGVLNAVRQIAVDPADVRLFYHGTTVSTNALLTRTGAKTALLATRGFRDILEVRDGMREELYDVTWNPPPPLIPRHDRLEVAERIAYDGGVVLELDEAAVREQARLIRKRGHESVAVCFMHAYANTAHEDRVKTILTEELPGVYISVSSEVMPEPPEYERTTTTVANAYVGPVLSRYMSKLDTAVRAEGIGGAVLIMHSGGGTMTPDTAVRFAIRTATSGLAGGVLAAEAIAGAIGRRNIVSLDVGGTSADIATIVDGKPKLTNEQTPEWGLPLRFPAIDVVAIGAGGGSIGWIDSAGIPHTGPQSAGARPGPACYDQGGSEPTTTDANLVLRRLRPDHFLGGMIPLRLDLAEKAVRDKFAEPLGLSVEEAAEGLLRIANENMANAIRKQTVHRGLDPRDFSLMAFGGAGPLFVVDVARELQMREAVVPANPGATSALGLLFADARHDFVRSMVSPADGFDVAVAEQHFRDMEAQAIATLEAEGFARDAIEIQRVIDLRYTAQVRAISVELPATDVDAAILADATAAFHTAYEREFRYALPAFPVESRSLRLIAIGKTPKPSFIADTRRGDAEAALTAVEDCYFGVAGGWVATRYYDRAKLLPGAAITGPAIIEQFDSTTVVPPGASLEVEPHGNFIITFKEA
jgi:N-methylhydantoinase A